ncbi:MAG TPA: hypothetical protein VJ994_15300 [Paracoccaceae bacterium]|nr:hypothetical protein [Paracoccaceae bacterium]
MHDARRNDVAPVVGACLPVGSLARCRDWPFDMDRDLEAQTCHQPGVVDGDGQTPAAEAAKALDGFKGRLGIHGPFRGFTIDSTDAGIREVVTRRKMQGLDVCERLGATPMVIRSPFTAWDAQTLDARPTATGASARARSSGRRCSGRFPRSRPSRASCWSCATRT